MLLLLLLLLLLWPFLLCFLPLLLLLRLVGLSSALIATSIPMTLSFLLSSAGRTAVTVFSPAPARSAAGFPLILTESSPRGLPRPPDHSTQNFAFLQKNWQRREIEGLVHGDYVGEFLVYTCLLIFLQSRNDNVYSRKIFTDLSSRRLCAEGGSCLRDLWRAWRIRDCRSA